MNRTRRICEQTLNNNKRFLFSRYYFYSDVLLFLHRAHLLLVLFFFYTFLLLFILALNLLVFPVPIFSLFSSNVQQLRWRKKAWLTELTHSTLAGSICVDGDKNTTVVRHGNLLQNAHIQHCILRVFFKHFFFFFTFVRFRFWLLLLFCLLFFCLFSCSQFNKWTHFSSGQFVFYLLFSVYVFVLIPFFVAFWWFLWLYFLLFSTDVFDSHVNKIFNTKSTVVFRRCHLVSNAETEMRNEKLNER